MAGKQLVVMISSTMRDLQQHRQHVLDVGKDSGKKTQRGKYPLILDRRCLTKGTLFGGFRASALPASHIADKRSMPEVGYVSWLILQRFRHLL